MLGSNLAVSFLNAGKARRKLADLGLLVVSDLFLSETGALADAVFPATQWAEETGTMTNLESRVLLRQKVTDVPNGVRGDADFLRDMAEKLGVGDKFPTDSKVISDELRRFTKGAPADYSGIS